MHRSGTSLATRALMLLGVSLGDDGALLPPGRDNPAGYWESRAISELDDVLLAHLGGSWDQPPVLDPGWEANADLDSWRDKAAEALATTFGPHEPATSDWIGWKDPRLSILLPFWRTVTTVDTTIVLVRDPDEVASSLLERNGIDAPQAAVLWLRYLFAATSNDEHHLLVTQDEFFLRMPETLGRLTRHLDLPEPAPVVAEEIAAQLDPSLRHHVGDRARPATDNPLVALARAVWNDGEVDLAAAPPPVADGLARGWIRPPIDAEMLARARAQVVELTDRLRKRWRAHQAAEAASAPESVHREIDAAHSTPT
jgi:hypothetical protein